MSDMSEETPTFASFLEKFAKEHPAPLGDEESLPIRLITYYLTEDEAEGECLDWAIEYLKSKYDSSVSSH